MLEVTHSHLPMMGLVVLLLTHLLIFAPYKLKTKVGFIISGFLFALLNESSGWLVRFVSPAFAWLKVLAFLALQATLGFLITALTFFLIKGRVFKSNYQAEKPKAKLKTAPLTK
jgi:predicted membrane protein